MLKHGLIILALLTLAACNNVGNAYRPTLTAEQMQQRKDLIAFEGEPTIRDGGNPDQELEILLRDGWAMIGESRYADNLTVPQQLAAKAKEVKAELVIKFRIGASSSSGVMPVSSGSGGMLFVPSYSTVEYYSATFWRRRKPLGTGVFLRDLSQEEAIKRGDANGAVVAILVKGFAGERSGLKVGDVVTHIGGMEVINAKDAVRAFQGHTVSTIGYRVLRDGQPSTIIVDIDPMPTE
ncbi:PDZ domain-containing protein [Ferrovibrio sp.]|uniref:PDZ domain-containing protein n=1 Tax=Ferrovibrio sp. TaxID=1917215 RepID=UPI00311DC7E2